MHFKRLVGLACAGALAGCVFIPTAASADAARSAGGASGAKYTIQGAGSTLVAPLEAEWASAWDNATGNTVSYNPVGSGTGYSDIANGQVDFGASDAPLSAYSSPSCQGCVQIPWGLTATGVSFNINNLGVSHLHLSGTVLANIYLGKITYWDNAAIRGLNKGVSLPHLKIAVFWRSDASGDSYAFTQYLSDVSSNFNHQVGPSTQPSFPVGTGAHGNGAMASAVQSTNGAIAYVAVSYLANDNLPAAGVKNAAGRFEVPNLGPIEAAAAVVHSVPANNQLTIVDPPASARSAYPISTFTYVMLPTSGSRFGGVPAAPIKQFIYYALHGGQQFTESLDFAPLPKIVLNAADNTLGKIH